MEAPPYWQRAKRELARADPILATIMRARRGIALGSRGDAFQTLACSIVGQQISVKAAASVWQKVLATVGGTLTPVNIAATAIADLRAAGLSQRKVEYVRELADRFASRRLDPTRWDAMDDEAIIADLTAVRGIGRWTAEMFLIFNLLRPDILPVADVGLQRAVSLHYRRGRVMSERTLRRIAEPWAPWRSVATWYLWRSLDPVPVEY
ncbi:MAG: DNA-3-methyladenine glycosylase 2 family protein [Betaproteobacteria bacterium]|nr:DNA-3-methyladenine glycosylase 2 family protein [Betaproteobacteria bacterium]